MDNKCKKEEYVVMIKPVEACAGFLGYLDHWHVYSPLSDPVELYICARDFLKLNFYS